MDVKVEEECPSCGGTGKIKSSYLFTDALESKIRIVSEDLGIRKFRLHVHPFVAAYINQGFISMHRRWQFHYGWASASSPTKVWLSWSTSSSVPTDKKLI